MKQELVFSKRIKVHNCKKPKRNGQTKETQQINEGFQNFAWSKFAFEKKDHQFQETNSPSKEPKSSASKNNIVREDFQKQFNENNFKSLSELLTKQCESIDNSIILSPVQLRKYISYARKNIHPMYLLFPLWWIASIVSPQRQLKCSKAFT